MNTREQVNQYLRGLETRLRWLAVLERRRHRLRASRWAPPRAGADHQRAGVLVHQSDGARIVLVHLSGGRLGLRAGAAAAASESAPRRQAAPSILFPNFEERLLTFVERREQHDPMLELLAADTAEMTRRANAGGARGSAEVDFCVLRLPPARQVRC